MKDISEMNIGELAAFVCSHLKNNGIDVILSGGSCVSIFTSNRYESNDLDFIEISSSPRKKIEQVLEQLEFFEENRYFRHPKNKIYIEFPAGPLAVGSEPVKEIITMAFSTGELFIISPTDCIKDRLAHYCHWKDRQCLEQALMVAEDNKFDLDEVKRFSLNEGHEKEFLEFKSLLKINNQLL